MLHDVEISHNCDGYWLNFTNPNGSKASLSLSEVLPDKGIIRNTILSWASLQSGGKPMNIPSVGDVIVLRKPWTAHIADESRNRKYLINLGVIELFDRKYGFSPVAFPVDTKFKIERIYIRQNAPSYDSVTVRVVGVKNSRFWVKLANFNEIIFEKES